MPVIKKPERTGIPVVDYLYSAEPDIYPAPLVPAITREALIKATKEALPVLNKIEGSMNNIIARNLADTLIQMIPQKHLAPIKSVEVIPPDVARALNETSNGIIRGLYLPDLRAVLLSKGFTNPATPIHEVGHDVFHYADPRYIEKVVNTYFSNPSFVETLSRYTPVSLHSPAEVFAESYAQNLLRLLGDVNAQKFFYALPPEIRNMPFQIKPYRGILD